MKLKKTQLITSIASAFSFLFFIVLFPTNSYAYNCTPNHCYGISYFIAGEKKDISGWKPGDPIFTGDRVNIMSHANKSVGDGFFTNETWVIEERKNLGIFVWIEAGLLYGNNPRGPITLVWAVKHHSNGNLYVHYGKNLAQEDLNHYVSVTIRRIGPQGWHINLVGQKTSFSGEVSDTMEANAIETGEELDGTKNASEDTTEYLNQQYATDGGSFQRSIPGQIAQSSPTFAEWLQELTATTVNNGNFYAWITQ